MQRRNATHPSLSGSDHVLLTMALGVSMIETRRLPKQILLKDMVVARTKLSLMEKEWSSGANPHIDTTLVMITWMVF
jgi:hypothetical protein